ncbi:MAG TPA: hypothetical protein VD837_18720 [Terriglobales bacterium]|nr:hypothetical protein [Terriglobales bacterium]
MRLTWRKLAIVSLLPLLFLGGCKKKRPPVPSPQQQAPTITQQQEPQPEGQAQPPRVSCTTKPGTVKSGEPAIITCLGSSPDNRPLMYNCVPSAGLITGAGPALAGATAGSTVKLDTTGLTAGSVTVSCTVTDDRGLRASTNAFVKVEVPPPPIAAKPKPKPRKRQTAKKPTDPRDKTVVNEGSETTLNGQLSAGIPEDEASQQRRATTQLRDTTESNLRSITRQLNSDEQAALQQIRTFLTQSRAADTDGDIERAYRLALKAQLLSEELVKR